MPQRLILGLTGAAALVLAAAMVAVLLLTPTRDVNEEAPAGTDLQNRAAPDFRLLDQNDRLVSLADLRGRPVVLTFLFTNCEDTCPLTAAKLRRVLDLLDSPSKVVMVAISVDPARDDRSSTSAFSEKFGLTSADWHYLRGAEAELRPVWQSYGVGTAGAGLGPAQVLHTDALFVIDAAGRQRRLLRSDFDPSRLAADLRALMVEQ
jgi:protein SCO1/2